MLNFCDKSYLGHKNEADVAIELDESDESFQGSLALQEYLGRCTRHVPK